MFLAHAGLKIFVFTVPGFVGYLASLGLPAVAAYAVLTAKVRGMPINPFPEKLACPTDTSRLPMLFVYCRDNPLGMFEGSRARAIERPHTKVVDLDARHALMLTKPDEVARLCHDFAR